MCPCAHFRGYGVEFDNRSCPRWCIRELSYKSPPPGTQPSGRFRPAEGVEQVVHVSVCTFPWLWSGIRQSILPEVVYQRVVVQVGSTWHLVESAIAPGRRCRAGSTCVRVHISVVMEWNSTIDLARGAESESCRTSRLHLALSRVGDCARPKVSSR